MCDMYGCIKKNSEVRVDGVVCIKAIILVNYKALLFSGHNVTIRGSDPSCVVVKFQMRA